MEIIEDDYVYNTFIFIISCKQDNEHANNRDNIEKNYYSKVSCEKPCWNIHSIFNSVKFARGENQFWSGNRVRTKMKLTAASLNCQEKTITSAHGPDGGRAGGSGCVGDVTQRVDRLRAPAPENEY